MAQTRDRLAGSDEPPGDRFRRLPDRVRPEDLIATQEAEPAPDPTMGRDPDRDFMLRYAGP